MEQCMVDTKALEIDTSKVMCLNEMASGAFGSVYYGMYKGDDVAVKLITIPRNISADELETRQHRFLREMAVWSTLRHENVAQLLGYSLNAHSILAPGNAKPPRGTPFWAIVMEFMSGGTLKNFINARQASKMAVWEAVKIALDVARGIEYLHSLKVVHRDLKSDNIILDHENRAKIADFGIARIQAQNAEDMTGSTGTLRWMAPEVIESRPYTHKADIYSLGIVLWELVACEHPFSGALSMSELANEIASNDLRPEIPPTCIPSLSELMQSCWSRDPEKRPEAGEVVIVLGAIQKDEGGPPEPQASSCTLQ